MLEKLQKKFTEKAGEVAEQAAELWMKPIDHIRQGGKNALQHLNQAVTVKNPIKADFWQSDNYNYSEFIDAGEELWNVSGSAAVIGVSKIAFVVNPVIGVALYTNACKKYEQGLEHDTGSTWGKIDSMATKPVKLSVEYSNAAFDDFRKRDFGSGCKKLATSASFGTVAKAPILLLKTAGTKVAIATYAATTAGSYVHDMFSKETENEDKAETPKAADDQPKPQSQPRKAPSFKL